jgi:hypothetical protein
MVKTIRMAVFFLASLACLTGCNLGAGIFPDRLMSYEAYVDLARFIDPDHAWDYTFALIRDSRPTSGYPEYLVLAYDSGPLDADCVVVFDADLKVLGHFTLDELNAMDPANQFDSCGAMVDASGYIVVGNRRFAVSSGKVTYFDTPPIAPHHPGLAIPEAPEANLVNIRGDVQNLKYGRFNTDWVFIGLGDRLIGTSSWHQVIGAWLTDIEVLLVVRHDPDPTETAHVLAIDRLLFAAGTACVPLRGTYTTGFVPSYNDIEWRTLGYTDEGFAAFRWTSTPEYCLFDKFGSEIAVSGEIPAGKRPNNQRHAYGRTSGWYIFDMNEMTLERRAWWWK